METIVRHTISKDWMTVLLLVVFFLIALTKYLFPERFGHFTKLPFSKNYLKIELKKMTLTTPFQLLLNVIHIISVSLFIFLVLKHLSLLDPETPRINFTQVALGYSIFFTVLYILEKITAEIFKIEPVVYAYVFYKVSFRNYIGLCLFPVNLALIYGLEASLPLLIIVSSAAALFYLSFLFVYYLKHGKFLYTNWFYFILYLCIFEISPYLILFKVANIA